MKKWTQFKQDEATDPRLASAGELGNKDREDREKNVARQPEVEQGRDKERQSAAEQGAEGTVDKNEKIKVHIFRYVGQDGDGLVMSKDRSEKKMQSDRWQYLGEFSLPGGFVNQLPRDEDDQEWRIVHKN